MLALCFRAGLARYAIAAREVVEVLPRVVLRPVVHAPAAVQGLLGFRGMLIPVVDLVNLLDGGVCPARLSTRLIVVQAPFFSPARTGVRYLALMADGVTDLIKSEQTRPGLKITAARYLGEHLVDIDELPQLIVASEILPESLSELFCEVDEGQA